MHHLKKKWKKYSLRTSFTSQNKSKSENLDRLSNKTLRVSGKKEENLPGSHYDTRPSRLNKAVSDKLITQCRYVRLYICGLSTNRLTLLTVHCTCKYGERTRETFNVDAIHTTSTYTYSTGYRQSFSRKYYFLVTVFSFISTCLSLQLHVN